MSSTTDCQVAHKPIDLVVVLGMHRSGTSAITRGLAALGVDLGKHLIAGIENDNAKGYFEDAEVHYVCDKVLAHFGRSWSSLQPLEDADFVDLAHGELMDTAVRVMQARVGKGTVYGLKNPRISTILPFWKMVFQRMNLAVGYVVAVRNPLSVASSMVRSALDRDTSFEKSHLLWLTHLCAAMALTTDEPRVVVDYDVMLDQPAAQLERLALGLALPSPAPDLMQDYANGFLHDGLRHSAFTPEDLTQAEAVPADVVQAYALARAEAMLSPPSKNAQTEGYFSRLRAQLASLSFVLSYVDRREAQYATATLIAGSAQAAIEPAAADRPDNAADKPGETFAHSLTQGLRNQFEHVQRFQQSAEARQGARLTQVGRGLQGVLDKLAALSSLGQGVDRIDALVSSFAQALQSLESQLRAEAAQQASDIRAWREEASDAALGLKSGLDAQFVHVLDELGHSRDRSEQQSSEITAALAVRSDALEQQLAGGFAEAAQAQQRAIGAATAELGAAIVATDEALRTFLAERMQALAGRADLDHAFATLGSTVTDLSSALQLELTREIAKLAEDLASSSLRHENLVEQQREQARSAIEQAEARLADLGERHERALAHLGSHHEKALTDLRADHALALDIERQRSADQLRRAQSDAAELRRMFGDMLAKRDEARARAEQDHARQLAALSRQFDDTLRLMEQRCTEQQAAFDARLDDHKAQLAERSVAHGLAVQALRQQLADTARDHETALHEQGTRLAQHAELLVRSHASELSTVKELAAAELRRYAEARDQALQELQRQAEQHRHIDQARVAELEKELDQIRSWKGIGLVSWWNQGSAGKH